MHTTQLAPLAYRVKDFCALAGISRAKFYEELKAGEISIIKVGSRTLIPAQAAEDWLASKAEKSALREADND